MTDDMEDGWFKRVLAEYAALCEKIDKLKTYLDDNEEADGLLVVQFYAMLQYRAVLMMRIKQQQLVDSNDRS